MDTLFIQVKFAWIFLILFFLMGCRNYSSRENKAISDSVASYPRDGVLYRASVKHFFSSVAVKDSFKLELVGEKITSGNITFTIEDSLGAIIYERKFESKDLVGYGLDLGKANEAEIESYILNRMDNFFREESFIKPMIGSEETYDSDYYQVDKFTWEELKRSNLFGFYYLLSEEDKVWIAYYKNKVLNYKTCC